ncbi:MAG: hypothetical protein K2I71_00135, partial [Helicobacter sp.]|nr:hypothetical protein [Helicobacter sp.]
IRSFSYFLNHFILWKLWRYIVDIIISYDVTEVEHMAAILFLILFTVIQSAFLIYASVSLAIKAIYIIIMLVVTTIIAELIGFYT